MHIRVLYFARLRETLGLDRETLSLDGETADLDDLLARLRARGGAWADALAPGRTFRIAVNQDLAEAGTRLRDGDEVALFPPVTGG